VPISRRNNVVYSARGNSRGHLSNSRSRPGTAGTITPVTPVTGWGGTKSIESPLLVPEMAGLAIAKTSAPIRAIQQQQHEHFDACKCTSSKHECARSSQNGLPWLDQVAAGTFWKCQFAGKHRTHAAAGRPFGPKDRPWADGDGERQPQ
jgi:hypothetical protein